MPNIVVVGAQWGDEGKGKVVDHLAEQSRWVVRFQGGNNAGHTLVVNGEKLIVHLVPSGVLHAGCTCVIGNGVVVDPTVLGHELDMLATRGHALEPDRLVLSTEAHLILPWHLALDQAREKSLGDRKIGTTGRGIGPAYEDKVGRRGVRVAELLDPETLRERVEEALAWHGPRLPPDHGLETEQIVAALAPVAARLRPYSRPTVGLLHEAIRRGDNILFEGAQGTFLDVDHGTYPFVTSSSTVAGGAAAGSGVGPGALHKVVGITKAYTTRVGSGPFPTELFDATGERLRAVGQEFGATTGRPRRCGWLDLPMLQHAHRLNGFSAIALTKLDVLSGMERIAVAVSYRGVSDYPTGARALAQVEVEYVELPGWSEDIRECRRFEDLPGACQDYVRFVEDHLGVPAEMLGVGPGREALILR